MPVPDEVEIDRIDSELLIGDQGGIPSIARDSLVKERRAVDKEWPRIHLKDRVGVLRDDTRDVPVRPSAQSVGASRRRNGKRKNRRQHERPPPLDASGYEIDDGSAKEPAEAKCDRAGARRRKGQAPAHERNQWRERVERHLKWSARPPRAQHAQRDDLRDALDKHDSGGKKRDDLVERKEARNQR